MKNCFIVLLTMIVFSISIESVFSYDYYFRQFDVVDSLYKKLQVKNEFHCSTFGDTIVSVYDTLGREINEYYTNKTSKPNTYLFENNCLNKISPFNVNDSVHLIEKFYYNSNGKISTYIKYIPDKKLLKLFECKLVKFSYDDKSLISKVQEYEFIDSPKSYLVTDSIPVENLRLRVTYNYECNNEGLPIYELMKSAIEDYEIKRYFEYDGNGNIKTIKFYKSRFFMGEMIVHNYSDITNITYGCNCKTEIDNQCHYDSNVNRICESQIFEYEYYPNGLLKNTFYKGGLQKDLELLSSNFYEFYK